MRRREEGFSIIELMIALAIVALVLAAATTFFIVSVNQFKVQTKIVETNVEGILGLELLRQDLEGLGFGLPWNNLETYTERPGMANLSTLEDASNPPRAVLSIDNASFTVNRSDYLVIKSVGVGLDNAAGKWTTLTQSNTKRTWAPPEENIPANNYVIVLSPGSTDTNRRSLVKSGTTYYTTYNDAGTNAFKPVEPYSANIVYGIGDAVPDRPFNRADYFIDNSDVPQKCAPNTGVLVKAPVTHDGGTGSTPTLLPLMDCVADIQVVYVLDTNADGVRDDWENDIRTLLPAAADLRTQLMEVRVHILAQEGQMDPAYTSPETSFYVGSGGRGRNFPISGSLLKYRWKVYSIVVKPMNLAQ